MLFAKPQLLWLLLVIPPALLAFLWWSGRKRQELMTRFIQTRLLTGLVSGISPARRKVRFGCLVLAIACLIVSLARPQWGFTWQEVKQRGVDIIVALDTSKSMLARDIAPDRLGRAKLAALELMQLSKSDRLGLVAFAGQAFLQCPLTIDDAAFSQSVQALDVNTIPEGGTALAEAINTALSSFKEQDNHKVLVLMTDGEDHDSGAVEAAKKAAAAGLRIYTIGIGTPAGELLRIKDAKGNEDYVRDEQGNVVKSHLNEDLLREIATEAGGFYLPLRGAKTIETLYDAPRGLASLPKSEHEQKLVKQYHERYHWPLGLAIALLLVEILLPERSAQKQEPVASTSGAPRGKRARRAASSSSRPATAAILVAAVIVLSLGGKVMASPASALREYKNGQYDQALQDYKKLLDKTSEDPRLHFNAGAAAYRNGQFSEATNQFSAALNSPDLKLQESAYYNRANSLFRLGEQTQNPELRSQSWEKALRDYDLTLKLNGEDQDAKFNREFVKKKLEQLKQQQQQQQQSKNDKDQKPEPQQQQQQSQSGDQNKQDQQKQQEQQQAQQNQSQNNPPNQKPQDQQQQQQQQAQQKQSDQQQQQAAQQAQQAQQQQASAGQNQQTPEEKERETAAYAKGEMTPEQAQHMLDAQKSEEQMLPAKPEGKPFDTTKPIKDW